MPFGRKERHICRSGAGADVLCAVERRALRSAHDVATSAGIEVATADAITSATHHERAASQAFRVKRRLWLFERPARREETACGNDDGNECADEF